MTIVETHPIAEHASVGVVDERGRPKARGTLACENPSSTASQIVVHERDQLRVQAPAEESCAGGVAFHARGRIDELRSDLQARLETLHLPERSREARDHLSPHAVNRIWRQRHLGPLPPECGRKWPKRSVRQGRRHQEA
jgi:hypothetical protein